MPTTKRMRIDAGLEGIIALCRMGGEGGCCPGPITPGVAGCSRFSECFPEIAEKMDADGFFKATLYTTEEMEALEVN